MIAGGLNSRYAFEHINEGIGHSKEHFAQDKMTSCTFRHRDAQDGWIPH